MSEIVATECRTLLVYENSDPCEIIRNLLESTPGIDLVAILRPSEPTGSDLEEHRPSAILLDRDALVGGETTVTELVRHYLGSSESRRRLLLALYQARPHIVMGYDLGTVEKCDPLDGIFDDPKAAYGFVWIQFPSRSRRQAAAVVPKGQVAQRRSAQQE